MVKNKNSKNYHVFLILLVLAILFSFGYMYFAFVQNPTGLTTYNESNQTNFPPEWIYNSTEFYTAQNAELIIDLNQYFFDENQDVLSYLATQPSSFSVSLEESVLTIKPDQNFVGERILTITASDNMNIVTQDIRIIVEETSSSFNQGDTIQDKDSKFVGKKVHDELDFETYFNYIIKNETGLFLSFYHDSVSPQSIWIDGEVGYELSSNLSSAYENVTLVVYRINQVIPKFKLHIGATSEVFEFGKEIPEVSIEDNEGNPANISFIDRDDEKLDIEVTKANAKAVIKGANTSQIQAKIDSINDSEIKTDVFAADSIDMEEAVISLPVQESINTIMECSDFNLTEFICQGEWIKTDIPFEKNESHITFTVSHFSGYGGANIEVLTVQSYPMVGSIWTVAFNTTGIANLTITAEEGTVFGEDLIFLSLSCGDVIINASYDGTKVFVENFNCSDIAYEKSTVLTEGRHVLKFLFGNESGFAFNEASSSNIHNLSHANFSMYGEQASSYAGYSIDSGDFNGDGINDSLIGAPFYGLIIGKVYVVYGPFPEDKSSLNLSNANVSWIGANASDRAGWSVAAGDVNGDGIDDILIGAPYYDEDTSETNTGMTYLIYGHAGLSGNFNLSDESHFNASIVGRNASDYSAWHIAVGDVNNDSKEDILIHAVWGEGGSGSIFPGSVGIVFGTNLSGNYSLDNSNATFWGEGNSEHFGQSIEVADVTGDGFGDIIVGATDYNREGTSACGKVYIINGSISNGMSGNVTNHMNGSFYGEGPTSNLGYSLDAGGDVNNDGIIDFLIGAETDDTVDTNSGKAYLVYGRSAYSADVNISTVANASWYGEAFGDRLGYSVLIGNLYDDSNLDIFISSYNNTYAGTYGGRFYVLYGPATTGLNQNISIADVSWYSEKGGAVGPMARGSAFFASRADSPYEFDVAEPGVIYMPGMAVPAVVTVTGGGSASRAGGKVPVRGECVAQPFSVTSSPPINPGETISVTVTTGITEPTLSMPSIGFSQALNPFDAAITGGGLYTWDVDIPIPVNAPSGEHSIFLTHSFGTACGNPASIIIEPSLCSIPGTPVSEMNEVTWEDTDYTNPFGFGYFDPVKNTVEVIGSAPLKADNAQIYEDTRNIPSKIIISYCDENKVVQTEIPFDTSISYYGDSISADFLYWKCMVEAAVSGGVGTASDFMGSSNMITADVVAETSVVNKPKIPQVFGGGTGSTLFSGSSIKLPENVLEHPIGIKIEYLGVASFSSITGMAAGGPAEEPSTGMPPGFVPLDKKGHEEPEKIPEVCNPDVPLPVPPPVPGPVVTPRPRVPPAGQPKPAPTLPPGVRPAPKPAPTPTAPVPAPTAVPTRTAPVPAPTAIPTPVPTPTAPSPGVAPTPTRAPAPTPTTPVPTPTSTRAPAPTPAAPTPTPVPTLTPNQAITPRTPGTGVYGGTVLGGTWADTPSTECAPFSPLPPGFYEPKTEPPEEEKPAPTPTTVSGKEEPERELPVDTGKIADIPAQIVTGKPAVPTDVIGATDISQEIQKLKDSGPAPAPVTTQSSEDIDQITGSVTSLPSNQITAYMSAITGYQAAAPSGYCGRGVSPPKSNTPVNVHGELEAQVASMEEHCPKCLPCPPLCPIPKIPKIEQPGDPGSGKSNPPKGGGTGAGGGESGLCDPGYEADEEFNRLSDDSEERKLLMENKLALDNPVDFAVDKVKGIFDAVLSIPEAIGKSIEKHSKNYDQKSLLTRSPQMIVPPRPRPTGSSGLAKISGGQVIDINDKNQLLSSVVTDGFIEIYNPLKKEVRLDGYELRDHTGNVILSFPSGSSIAPEEYQVIAFSPLFEENFGIKPDYVFDGFSVDKFKGTVVLAYNGQEGFKYVDYVRYGEKSKPMYISGDTSPVKQRFIPINLEEEKEIIISEISIDYGNQLAFIEIVNVGKKDYILNNHNIVVYAGENYYSGDINNMVLKPGETFIFEFGVSGQASEINEDWICPGEVENGVCLSVPVAKDTKAVSINDLENVIQASHSGLMPRVEVALSKRVCTPECKTEVIEHFLKELDSVPYSGIKSYKVSEQKIFRGSKERSEDFVEDISPSLGFIEAFENRVVADIISPGWKSKKSLLTGAAITDTIRSEVSMLSGSSIETSPAFSSAPIPEMPAVYESYKQEDLSIEDLEQAKLEYFEYPCGTILRLNEEKGDKKQKKKSIRQKIDDFDVDKELADILNKLKQDGIDVDNPDVFKKQLGNIHVRLVERLFESVWESDFFIENYKSDHRALISSFFSYDLKKELEDIPIVQFEHRFDWKEKLIFLNDFRLREDFLNLNIEEKLFDINRALYYRLGYDYRVYSTVYSPLSAHWFAVKFGGVPSQDWNNKRIGVNEDIFDLIIRGIGNIFSFPVYVNGFARAWNNLDKVETSMNELLYKDKEIDAVMSIIEKYPSEVSPDETLGMFGISPEESSEEYEDKYGIDFDTLVETCLAARNALSGANRQGFGEPIVSFQRIDMKEGNEFKQGPRTVITRETPPSPYFTGSVVSEILEYDDFVSSIKDNRISDLVSEKNVLQENLRKGIDVEDSKEKIYSIDKEITALDSSFKRDMNVLEDTLPDINALELRSPQDVKVDSLTDMNSEYSSEENDEVCEQGACGANKCWKECEDLHLLLTEIFPGTVVMFPENKISKEEAVNVPVAAENIVSEEVLTSLEEGAFVSITGAQVVSGSSEHGTGENGIVLHDETSEDVDNTWELLLACPGMGPGECEQYSPEPISSPEPFGVDWPYAYEPEEEPVACGYVSDSASTNRINPQYTGDEFTIPLGYEIIKGPFSMECVGDSFDFSFNVPDNFRNVKVLRCRGLMCTEVLLSETPVEELVCDGEVVSTQIGDEFNTRQPALDPLMLDVVIDVEKSLDINNVIQEKGYSVEFDVSGFDVRLFTPKDFVSAPENAHYYFMGAPIVIEADVPENIGAVITMPLVPREDYSGFGIFVFVDGEWRSLESRVSNGFVSARVDDLKSLMVDNRVMFAVMGMYCHTCVGTEFKKVYDGGSKEAVVLVHGLTSTPATWQYMISDFSLSRQPHQVWVFGYPSSMSLDDVSIALANHLHEHSSEYNKIHLVGHSLGGLIIQQAVNFGNLNKYGFVSKVNKEILVGTPNKGSPAAKIYDSLRTFLINSKKLAGVYFLNPLVIDDVVNGRNIPRVPGIKYFVVAGTKSYPFSLGYFDNVNDGIVSVDSARFVGGIECGDMCSNYFEIDLTHTDLISHPIARNVIEYIISLEQSIEYPDLALLGFNQYGHTWIDECSPSDQFVIVGQRIAELETPGILDCRCGDDICGEGETVFSCPADCAMAIGAWICPWLPSAIPVLLLIAVVLTSVYLVTKRLQKKEVSTAWKIIDYAVVIISVILLILGIIICRYVSLLAIIILLIIIILLLLDLFFSGKKEKFAKIKKISKKKRK